MRPTLMLAFLFAGLCAGATAAEQTRAVAPFSSIDVKGPVDMVVHAGKAQSIQLKGNDKFLARLQTRVAGGKLMISFPHDQEWSMKGNPTIVITVPALNAFHVEGAGSVELNNIQGEELDLGFKGAGRLVANGKVGQLRLAAEGVGDVNTRQLQASAARVSFEGIGAVKVFASERLDASVQGMGSLNYYGNPRIVNKQVEGIGSVKSGN